MALGFCPECDRLVSIRPGPQKWGSRECDWYPMEHDAPGPHKGCGGQVRNVAAFDEPLYQCMKCLQPADGDFEWVRCSGVSRAIR